MGLDRGRYARSLFPVGPPRPLSRRRLKFFAFCSIILFFVAVKRLLFPTYDEVPVDPRRRLAPSSRPCVFPRLRLDDPLLAPFFHPVDPFQCDPRGDLVCIRDQEVGLCSDLTRWLPHINPEDLLCDYDFLKRLTDDSNDVLVTRQVRGRRRIKLEADFFDVLCRDAAGTAVWKNTMAGIARVADLPKSAVDTRSIDVHGPSWSGGDLDQGPKPPNRAKDSEDHSPKDVRGPSQSGGGEADRGPKPGEPPEDPRLNFLMFGFDSLSRLSFIRKLPKLYDTIRSLGGVVLRGYNIVGDGTPQAFLPILTGLSEPELPEARRRKIFTSHRVDVFPFVWKRFRQRGYVTAYAEDSPSIGTFNYRLSGFERPPTDHYMRPFYLRVDEVKHEHADYCLAGTPRHKVHLDWIERFIDAYPDRPKFMVSFHCELSHEDINRVGLTDDDAVQLLTSLRRKGHLNNTMVVVMSDHGNRFSEIRQTKTGKYEERLPFFSLLVPEAFKTKHPVAWINLQANADRLTSPFDIYSTIGHLLDYSEETPTHLSRSISLFHKIPELRSCEDAGIEPHWCTCLNWGQVDPGDPLVRGAADALLGLFNAATEEYRSDCALLSLKKIEWAERFSPSLGMLQFKQAADPDGFKGDFSATYQLEEEFYQIKVVTSPGNGGFEATLRYDMKRRRFDVGLKDVSRVNRYGRSADCVRGKNDDLLKFCYCEDTTTSSPS